MFNVGRLLSLALTVNKGFMRKNNLKITFKNCKTRATLSSSTNHDFERIVLCRTSRKMARKLASLFVALKSQQTLNLCTSYIFC